MTEQEIDEAILDLLANDSGGSQRKVAFVVARIAGGRANDDELNRVEAAIQRLVAAGTLEAFGDVSEWRHSEVRLIT